jgi:hypothetical protein
MTLRIGTQDRQSLNELEELKVIAPDPKNINIFSQRTLKLRCTFANRNAIQVFVGGQQIYVDLLYPLKGRLNIAFSHQKGGPSLKDIIMTDFPGTWNGQEATKNVIEIPITDRDIEELSAVRSGQDLYVRWEIAIQCLAHLTGPGHEEPVFAVFGDSPRNNSEYLHISPQNFSRDFIEPSGLPERLLLELPFQSVPDNLREKLPIELHKLVDLLSSAVKDLKSASESLRLAKSASEYRGVIVTVRLTIEKLRDEMAKEKIKLKLAEIAYLKAGIMDGDGAQEAAEEAVDSIYQLAKSLFNITSKSPHGATLKTKTDFTMYPDENDAKMDIFSALNCVSYVISRLEYYVTYRE